MNALTAHGSGLPAWWGRFPLGVPFARSKGTKTRLGRSPLRTSLGYEAGPRLDLRQVSIRPVTLAVASVTAITPGYPG